MAAENRSFFDSEPSAINERDDSLLLALLSICKILHRPFSAEALTSGLPLVNNKLTPNLFIRSAERAGFSTKLIKRPLNQISNLVLPAVLLLKNNKTCILIANNEGQLRIILPESNSGEKTVSLDELQQQYLGCCFFIQINHQFDDRTLHSATPKVSHWFWDVIFKSWPIYIEVLIASLLINLFALASPLFVMNVYDRVVPNHALETLWVLAIGVTIVYLFDFIMKLLRGYFIDIAGKRSDIILSATIFEKVLGIKMELVQHQSVHLLIIYMNLNHLESF